MKIEVGHTFHEDESLTLTEHARKVMSQVSGEIQQQRRQEAVHGKPSMQSHLIVNAFCLMRQEGSQLRMETVDALPHNIGQLVVHGPSAQACECMMRVAYLAALQQHRVVPDPLEAADIAGRSKFPSMRSDL